MNLLNEKINKAITFAACAHHGQFRKGTDIPYIIHPLTVYEICKNLTNNEDYLIVALLHDTIEDTNVTYEQIKKEFGQEVADIVDLVTLKDKDGDYLQKRLINLLIIRDKENLGPILIRGCDALANLNSMYQDIIKIGRKKLFSRFNGSRKEIDQYYGFIESLIEEKCSEFPILENLYNEIYKIRRLVFTEKCLVRKREDLDIVCEAK